MGIFPIRGRPINVSATTMAKIKENKEFESIRNIIGLKYGEKADPKKLNFGKIVISADFDEFGASISGLLINMFYRLWPEIITEGMLYRLITPVVLVTGARGMELEFYSLDEFEKWSTDNKDKKFTYRFLKGLGSNNSKPFKKYLSNPDKYMVQFTLEDQEDRDLLDLCFLKDNGYTDRRKEWLDIEDR
jgi:DNA topoisomerase-2